MNYFQGETNESFSRRRNSSVMDDTENPAHTLRSNMNLTCSIIVLKT